MKRAALHDTSDADVKKPTKLEDCPHGLNCFRRNPHHFKEFDHPHLTSLAEMKSPITIPEEYPQSKDVYLEQLKILKPLLKKQDPKENKSGKSMPSLDSFDNPGPGCSRNETPKNMLEKHQRSAPYYFFFTTIPKSSATLTHSNSITFTDILCPSLGKLKCSLQINFMIDISWLIEQYKIRNLHETPLTILYGDDMPKMKEYMDKYLPNVTYHLVKMRDPFGCHHPKIGIYSYEDGSLRVVVSTANLYYEDWNIYNQGLWISPLCPPLPSGIGEQSLGESPTGFKSSLLQYLKSYTSVNCLQSWIEKVKNADFSEIRVFLVYSTPGRHYPRLAGSHIHRMGDLLSRHCHLPAKTDPTSEGPLSWGIIAQASSIGSLGKSPSDWLRGVLLRSLAVHQSTQLVTNSKATFNIIFPTVKNVLSGYYGVDGGGCLPYSKHTNEKQRWLQAYLHQWKADLLHRTRAMPHIKSYCRVSPCLTKLAWFLLTSANISKSAWGGNIQKDGSVYVRSYEAGVLFLPNFFDMEYLEIAKTTNSKNSTTFPFMYDLPLESYGSDDSPWCT